MFYVRELEVTNFCQHAHRKLEFPVGITGIFGPNGAGKSNLMKALFLALTGENLNHGRKEENVRRGESDGKVRAVLDINGNQYVVERAVKTARAQLVMPDGQILRKSSEINDKLASLLGADANVLRSAVFAHQKEVARLVEANPADSKALFFRLFGLGDHERLRTLLLEEMNQTVLVSYLPQIQELESRLEEINGAIERLMKIIEEDRRNLAIFQEQERQLKPRADAYVQALNSKRAYDTLKQTIDASLKREHELSDRSVKLTADIDRLQKSYESSKQSMERAQQIIVQYEAVRNLQRDLKKVTEDRREAIEKLQYHETELAELKSEIGRLRAEYDRCVAALEQMQTKYAGAFERKKLLQQSLDEGICKLCGRPVTEEMRAILADMENIDINVDDLKRACSNSETALKLATEKNVRLQTTVQYEHQRVNDCNQRIITLREALGSMSNVDVSDEQIDEYSKFINMMETLHDTISSKQNELAGINGSLAGLREELTRNRATLGQYEQLMSNLVYENDYARYTEVASTVQELLNKITVNQHILEERKLDAERIQRQLDELRKKETEAKSLLTYREILEGARAILHRDMLPSRLGAQYLEALNRLLSKFLNIFDATFTCQITNEFTFRCKVNGENYNVQRLSAGQTIVLALSLRFAINALFAGDIALLVLDEPTIWLDRANVSHVYDALQVFKESSQSLQVILVTHDEELEGVCDKVYRI